MARLEGCRCDFRTYMVGDGCSVCRPDRAAKTERRSWAELEECIDELYRRMDRVDPPDDYPTMAEQYRRAERWKRIEAAADAVVIDWSLPQARKRAIEALREALRS